MKVCIVQSSSIKGEVELNIKNHVRLIELALESEVDMIVFPELSITNYEPALAERLACHIDDTRFDVLQKLADVHDMCIAIGAPVKIHKGITISTIFFQPQRARLLYSKERLHEDELPYFVSGKSQPKLVIKDTNVAFGICYETLHRDHFIKAKEQKADVFIASVAKPDRGISKAFIHFPSMAKEFNLPVLMSNCIGPCDNFISAGKSTVWDTNGTLADGLDSINEGLIIYDHKTRKTNILQPLNDTYGN